MKRRAPLALAALLVAACGGSAEERVNADPLPEEFPFEYVSMVVSGAVAVATSDEIEYTMLLSPADGRDRSQGGLYPAQYGIGYFYPLEGTLRATLSDCEDQDTGFAIATCEAELSHFELRIPGDEQYPDPFTDEASVSLVEPVRGSAVSYVSGSYEVVFEPTELLLKTKSGASRSRYAAELSASFDADAFSLQGALSK